MLLAELQIWHSRRFAPTRRLALGECHLPSEPPPGPGGLLLGAIVARFAGELDDDDRADIRRLMREVHRGDPIGQPRLRHRFQSDRVGLSRSRHRLVRIDGELRFELETAKASAAQSVLAAVYACEMLPEDRRSTVLDVLGRGLDWVGPAKNGLVDHLLGADMARLFRAGAFGTASDPLVWALDILGLDSEVEPAAREVQRRYRELLRDAHPDHGGGEAEAADRIATLARAREILLS